MVTPRKKKPTRAKPKPQVEPEPVVVKQSPNLLVYALIAGVLFFAFKDNILPKPAVAPTPVVAPTPTPLGTLTLTSLPALTAKLQTAPVKAKAISALFKDWAVTIGSVGSTVTTKQALLAVNTSLVTMYVKAANVPLEPQVGAEIDACLKEALGDDPGPLDVAKAQAAFNTMAQALDTIK